MEVIAIVTSNAGSLSYPGEERKLALYGNLVPNQYSVPVAKYSMYLLFIIFICNIFLS